MPKIEINTQRTKLTEVDQLLAQIETAEQTIAAREATSANPNFAGNKAEWDKETQRLRVWLSMAHDNYSLTLLTWAKQVA